jgi:peptidoglycan/xylan/chitin deacetylase (PgdA/CDA1 family)
MTRRPNLRGWLAFLTAGVLSSAPVPAFAAGGEEKPEPAERVMVDGKEVEIRRAIPVDQDPPAQVLPPDLADLPNTLPDQPNLSYTRCEVEARAAAITFDDGPHGTLTPRLLDILRERNVKATFFMVGQNVAAYPAIVKRMVEEGHEVASHSWSHPQLTALGAEGVRSQLRRTHDAIEQACGVAPVLYRPPYGATRLTQRRSIMDEFGYPTILWDVDPLDWQHPRTVQKVRDRVLRGTRRGSIVLLHDIHASTIDAVPAILDELIARDFKLVTVSQLLQLEAAEKAARPAAGELAALPGLEQPAAEPVLQEASLQEAALPNPSVPEAVPVPDGGQ